MSRKCAPLFWCPLILILSLWCSAWRWRTEEWGLQRWFLGPMITAFRVKAKVFGATLNFILKKNEAMPVSSAEVVFLQISILGYSKLVWQPFGWSLLAGRMRTLWRETWVLSCLSFPSVRWWLAVPVYNTMNGSWSRLLLSVFMHHKTPLEPVLKF